MNDEQRYAQGIQVRTEVLGEEHVGRSLENLNDFNEDFQNFISRFAWGEVWSRPGMARHTRSLVTIAILLALAVNLFFMLKARRIGSFLIKYNFMNPLIRIIGLIVATIGLQMVFDGITLFIKTLA